MWPYKNSAISISLHHSLSRDKTLLDCIFMQLAPKEWHTAITHAQISPGSIKVVTYTENQKKLALNFLKCRALNDSAPFLSKCQQPSTAQHNLKSWHSLEGVPLTWKILQTTGRKGYLCLFKGKVTNGIFSMQSTSFHFGTHGHQFGTSFPPIL